HEDRSPSLNLVGPWDGVELVLVEARGFDLEEQSIRHRGFRRIVESLPVCLLGEWTAFGKVKGVLDLPLNLRLDHGFGLGLRQPLAAPRLLEQGYRAVAFPELDLFRIAVAELVIPFGTDVPVPAVGIAFDERGPVSPPGRLDGLPQRVMNQDNVIAENG